MRIRIRNTDSSYKTNNAKDTADTICRGFTIFQRINLLPVRYKLKNVASLSLFFFYLNVYEKLFITSFIGTSSLTSLGAQKCCSNIMEENVLNPVF